MGSYFADVQRLDEEGRARVRLERQQRQIAQWRAERAADAQEVESSNRIAAPPRQAGA